MGKTDPPLQKLKGTKILPWGGGCYQRGPKPQKVQQNVGLAVKKTLAFIFCSFITFSQWQDPISPEKYISENPLLTKNTLLLIFILAFEQQLFERNFFSKSLQFFIKLSFPKTHIVI